jgi:hypothetical protein
MVYIAKFCYLLKELNAVTKHAAYTFDFRGTRVLLEKPPVAQLLKHIPKFSETRRSITVFTTVRH